MAYRIGLIISSLIIILVAVNGMFISKEPQSFNERLMKARQLLSEVPLIDG